MGEFLEILKGSGASAPELVAVIVLAIILVTIFVASLRGITKNFLAYVRDRDDSFQKAIEKNTEKMTDAIERNTDKMTIAFEKNTEAHSRLMRDITDRNNSALEKNTEVLSHVRFVLERKDKEGKSGG